MIDKIKIATLSIVAIFAPVHAVMITAMVLIAADFFTGVIAAYKRGEKITSAAFSRTMVKTFVYQSAIMLGFLTETYLTGASIPVSKIVTSYIGLMELTSVIENLNEISGGSLMKALVQKLGSANVKVD